MACQRTKKKKKKKKMQLRRRKCREKWKSICLKRNTPCVLWKWVEKMIIFSIFKFVFTFPNISYNFLIFSNRMNFPERFFHSFFAFKSKSIVFPHTTRGKHSQMKIDRSWKTHRMNKHTHTHISIIERVFLHTNCQCL